MVVTGVTAMQPLMSPGHLAACREPWVMTKVCTPPAHLLSAFSVVARAPAGFCKQTHQTWPRTLPCGTGVFVAGCRSKPSSSAPAPRLGEQICWQARFASILPENPTWPETPTGRVQS